jgi:hypothetical protein
MKTATARDVPAAQATGLVRQANLPVGVFALACGGMVFSMQPRNSMHDDHHPQ